MGWLSVVLMLLLIWPYVRAVQYYRLRQLLTVPDDAADGAAITSIVGRHLDMGAVQMVALAGQRPGEFRSGDRARIYGRWERRGPALITDGEKLLIGFAKRLTPAAEGTTAQAAMAGQLDAPPDIITEPLIRQYPQLARKPRPYLVLALILPVIVVTGSIAVIAAAGKVALGPLWIAWLICALWVLPLVMRYRLLSRLLHRPHVARSGVVTRVTNSGGRTTIATITMTDEKTLRLRLIGERQVPWLAEGQEVFVLRLPTITTNAVVLATEGGQAALALAAAVPAQEPTAMGRTS